MSFQVYDERIAIAMASSLAPADTTVAKSFWTADAQVRRLDTIVISSTDTVDRIVQLALNLGSTDQPLFEIAIPALSGHGVVPPVEVFKVLNLTNLMGMVVPISGTLRWNVTTTVTAAKLITAVAFGGIF